MKNLPVILFMFVLLFSCKQNTSQTVENTSVQHDTVKTTKMFDSASEKDSVLSDGEYIQHYKNGVTKMRGMMKNGKREGLWKSFYDNGAPWSETTFSEGKKNGKTTTWFENEKKRYEGYYTNDTESGKWTFWNEQGQKVNEHDYGNK